MGRSPLTYTDYVNLGRANALAFRESMTPRSERTNCKWRCLECGEDVVRSLRNIRENGGHRCTNPKALLADDYHALAISLNIFWTGSVLPANTKELTFWLGTQGQTVEASYAHLKYHLTDVMKQRLGIV